MAEAAASWEALDRELIAMMDTFTALVKAARIPDDESEQVSVHDGRRDRAPNDLLEVWAEKLTHAGHNALMYVGQLKSQALFSDFDTLMNRARKVRLALASEDQQVTQQLSSMKQEVYSMQQQLEASYYGCPHRGAPREQDMSAELKELAAIAMELAERPDSGATGAAAQRGQKPPQGQQLQAQ